MRPKNTLYPGHQQFSFIENNQLALILSLSLTHCMSTLLSLFPPPFSFFTLSYFPTFHFLLVFFFLTLSFLSSSVLLSSSHCHSSQSSVSHSPPPFLTYFFSLSLSLPSFLPFPPFSLPSFLPLPLSLPSCLPSFFFLPSCLPHSFTRTMSC